MTKIIENKHGKHYLEDDQQWLNMYVMLEVEVDGDVIEIERSLGGDHVNLTGKRSLFRTNRNHGEDEVRIVYSGSTSGNTAHYFKRGEIWVAEDHNGRRYERSVQGRTFRDFERGMLEHKVCEVLQACENLPVQKELFPNLATLQEVFGSYL